MSGLGLTENEPLPIFKQLGMSAWRHGFLCRMEVSMSVGLTYFLIEILNLPTLTYSLAAWGDPELECKYLYRHSSFTFMWATVHCRDHQTNNVDLAAIQEHSRLEDRIKSSDHIDYHWSSFVFRTNRQKEGRETPQTLRRRKAILHTISTGGSRSWTPTGATQVQ
jgi:hypothetical protein